MAFIEPMHRNKPNITYLPEWRISYVLNNDVLAIGPQEP